MYIFSIKTYIQFNVQGIFVKFNGLNNKSIITNSQVKCFSEIYNVKNLNVIRDKTLNRWSNYTILTSKSIIQIENAYECFLVML